MTQLSYSFCMSMLHSFWQAGLLVLVYLLVEKSFQARLSPLQKRNWLFVLLGTQLTFSTITFLLYYFKIDSIIEATTVSQKIASVLSADTLSVITPWLFSGYLVAIIYKMVQSVYEWYHFKKRFYSGLQKPSIDLKLFTTAKANHFGIKRKVQLWFSNTINVPLTFGFFKPIIVLPVALVNHLNIQQAETLILHELTHIKANDYLLNWALILAENIFFFNPFIIPICKKIRLEREKYCDSSVIAFQYSPLLYAETLLQAQHIRQYIPQYQLAAVTGKAQLLQRIQYFTNGKNFSSKKSNRVFPLLSFLLIALITATIFFQCKIAAVAKPAAINIMAPVYPAVIENEITTPTIVNNIIESLTDDKLKEMTSAAEQQQPVIEKQLKKLDPLIKSIQEQAESFANEFGDNNNIIPVALKESVPTRKIIVKEEQSGTKDAVLKVYTVSLINGQWVIVPEWMLASKEIPDSLQLKMDSTAITGQE
jgi:beta-lactamase regulating signal transducer with metallopeptidase domain